MGRKNTPQSEKRRQRKREKRNAKRNKRRAPPRGGEQQSPPSAQAEIGVLICIDACRMLLAGAESLPERLRAFLREAGRAAGGLWSRLPFELERFLEGEPWELTCEALEPLRAAFEDYDAEDAFERLWVLSLSNEPSLEPFIAAAARTGACAHLAALAGTGLLSGLGRSAEDFSRTLPLLVRQIEAHGGSKALVADYERLLRSAHASVHAPPAGRERAVAAFGAECRAVFERHADMQADTAWWQSGRIFLREVFETHADAGYAPTLAAVPGLLAQLYGPAEGAVLLALLSDSNEPLRAVHYRSSADTWLAYLAEHIDVRTLDFEDRVRYEIARLKLARATPPDGFDGFDDFDDFDDSGDDEGVVPDAFLAAFARLRSLLAHGVPGTHRDLPGLLEPALLDLYVAAVGERGIEQEALKTTTTLLRVHSDDFRLACLYAWGALLAGDRELDLLRGKTACARVDAELFARLAHACAGLPRGQQALGRVRQLLFDPLDRGHRKQCLIKLSQQALRSAATLKQYDEELRTVLPFIARDDFVFSELQESSALEPALVFLATMAARLHGMKLTLNENQSLQWVGYAREIAAQNVLGARLERRYLETPGRAFSLTPAVRAVALSEWSVRQAAGDRRRGGDRDDAEPGGKSKSPKSKSPTSKSSKSKSSKSTSSSNQNRRKRKTRGRASPPEQTGFFDALDP